MGENLPRLGFLGVGGVGRRRLEALVRAGVCHAVAVSDPSAEAVARAQALAPGAQRIDDLEGLLKLGLDGVVIASPRELHADQAVAALNAGLPVFCHKPLGCNAAEVAWVVAAAAGADRLVGVDRPYRHTAALSGIRQRIQGGELGRIYAVDLVFHNAYGPSRRWFCDAPDSTDGCVMEVGSHLVDAALWMLGFPRVIDVRSRLYAGGRPLEPDAQEREDHAVVELLLADGITVRLACSWDRAVGREAVVEVSAWGTDGGAGLRNVNGSRHDFVAERYRGARTEPICGPPDAWEGRAAVAWARRLATNPGFEPEIRNALAVAEVLDRIYGRVADVEEVSRLARGLARGA